MAVNPAIVTCTKDQWTKVITAQVSGRIHVLNDSPSAYYQTYRLTGESAPTDLTEAVKLTNTLEMSSTAAIDVYVYAKDKAGSVRVDV